MIDERLSLPDGRILAYTDIGNPDGSCVINFHGAPTSRLLFTDLDEEFADCGIRLISPDRPGYGGSSPQPGRSMADWPADVTELADALGVESFVVLGSSSGGPYAVACCAMLTDRVDGGLVVAGVTDMGWSPAWDGLEATELAAMEYEDEESATAWCTDRFGADGGGFFDGEPIEWPAPDEAYLADDATRDHLEAAITEAFAQGVAGYAQDMVVQGRPWPFDPATIRCPVHVVHGGLDEVVPLAHSRHTAEMIPGAELKIVDGHGHASIADEIPQLTAELVDVAMGS